jgi:hypothetical protein
MEELIFIKDKVEEKIGVNISSKLRDFRSTTARWLYFRLARQYTSHSLSKIGQVVNRDHSTVVYGLKKIKDEFQWNDELQTEYDTLSIICRKHFVFTSVEDIDKSIKFMHRELIKLYELKKQITNENNQKQR